MLENLYCLSLLRAPGRKTSASPKRTTAQGTLKAVCEEVEVRQACI